MASNTPSVKALASLMDRSEGSKRGLVRQLTEEAGMSEIQIARQGVPAVIVKTVVDGSSVGKGFISEFTTIPRSTFDAKVKEKKALAPTEAD